MVDGNIATIADQVHALRTPVFPGGSGLFQLNNAPCHIVHIEHDEEFRVLLWPTNSPNSISWASVGCAGPNSLTPSRSLQDSRDLLLMSSYQNPYYTYRGGFVKSMVWNIITKLYVSETTTCLKWSNCQNPKVMISWNAKLVLVMIHPVVCISHQSSHTKFWLSWTLTQCKFFF